MPKPSGPKVTKLTVDLSGVGERRAGGKAARVPEGPYLLELTDASVVPVKSDKTRKQVLWIWKIVKGQKTGGTIYHRTGLWPEALWAFRNILEDLRGGKALPAKEITADVAKYIGKQIGADLVDDEPYNDTIKSIIADTYPASEWSAKGSTETEEEIEEDADEATEEMTSDDDDEELEEIDTDDLD